MADLILTAMVTPNNQITYCTRDATPYRGDDANIIYALPQHVAELTALGFTSCTAAQVPTGDALQLDMGWSVAT